MKRRDLLRHFKANGCYFVREGGNHSIYGNINNGKQTSIPRHSEVNNFTARDACKDLGIPAPKKK
ncbi:MAG TPA: type II toxin-antitoxin system HicA family toxin [Candidatus Paceibacterota bacterium]